MRRLWQQEIIPSLPSISDRAAANEIPALGRFSFPTSNQSSHWWMGFAGRTSHSLSKNETGTSQKINIGNWFIWFEGMFWLSSVSVPGKGWTVGALGSTWSASNLGWDLGQKQKGENTIGEKKNKIKQKRKGCSEFWILLVRCQLAVLGEGMWWSTLPCSPPLNQLCFWWASGELRASLSLEMPQKLKMRSSPLLAGTKPLLKVTAFSSCHIYSLRCWNFRSVGTLVVVCLPEASFPTTDPRVGFSTSGRWVASELRLSKPIGISASKVG